MQAHLKAYGWFILYMAVTKIVIKPIADNLNVPLIKDVLA